MPDATRWVPIGSITNKLLDIDGVSYQGINATYPTGHPSVPATSLALSFDMETLTGGLMNDFSGNDNDGTITGASDTTGKIGNSRDFNDATDTYITVVDDASFDGMRTVACWILPEDGHSSSSARRYVINHRDNTGDFPGFQILLHENGTLIVNDDPGAGGNISAATTQASWTNGQWYHIATVADDTNMTVYVDGVQDGQTAFATAFTDSVNLVIGTTSNLASSQSMDGKVDEVLIFTRDLSVGEIVSLAEAWTSGATRDEPSLESNLVCWYDMETLDSSDDMLDLSGNSNAGTITGAIDETGIKGRSRTFDGANDEVTAVDSASLSITGDMTIAAWVNPDDFAAARTIVAKLDGGETSGWAFWTTITTGVMNFRVGDGAANDSAGSAGLTAATWQHVAVVFDAAGDTVDFYINGASDQQRAETANITDSGGTMRVGLWTDASQDWLGEIDEFMVWDRALTTAEITALYETGQIPAGTLAAG